MRRRYTKRRLCKRSRRSRRRCRRTVRKMQKGG